MLGEWVFNKRKHSEWITGCCLPFLVLNCALVYAQLVPSNPLPTVIGMNDPQDVTGDDRADLVWRNMNNGATMVWAMTSEALRGPITFPGSLPLNWVLQGVADVNGDKTGDLVWRNTDNGATHVWPMAGGLRGPPGTETFPGAVPLNWGLKPL